ncbi:MAG: rhodanese-like domain-containing protein [Simkaniaceae bacterium]|nr:rhodanese-like domain-containing protein [Simkaniaceae bacterium]
MDLEAILEQARRVVEEVETIGDEVLIDVREENEWEKGHIEGAIHIPRGLLEFQIEKHVKDKSQPILLYCAGGARSLVAALTLKNLGFTEVKSLKHGIKNQKLV